MRLLILILAGICFTACADQQKTIKLIVKATAPIEGGWVKLEKIADEQTLVPVDSFQYTANQPKEFNVAVDQPTLYRVNFFGRQFVNVILNTTDAKVEAAGSVPNGGAQVTGSPDTDLLNGAIGAEQEFQAQVQSLDAAYIEARNNGNMDEATQLQQQYFILEANHLKNLKNKIWAMDNSISALFATSLLKDQEASFTFLDSVATRFKTALPNSAYTNDLVRKVEGIRSTAIGSFAPEIDLPTPDGDNLALSSLRGKYVLVDFWAAWCRPCRMENPNVVRAYQQFASKGFEVYGVSLDRKKEDWVKAIEADGLPWAHVSDLKYFQSEAASLYNITFIPASFLLDPEGKIVAKNLRGEDLIRKLSELLD
jgi:peroxiredoxin